MDGMDMAGMFEAMAETVTKDPEFQRKIAKHSAELLINGTTTLSDGSIMEARIMRQIRIARGGTHSRPAAHRWYWRVTDTRGNGQAESAGSFDSPVQAIESLKTLFVGSAEPFQWLIGKTPRDPSYAFTATVNTARNTYEEVTKK
ncbi:hypothetical protein SEA_LINETTI_65 [Gordonia phage Linetti]|nr:hypothetical protein SEA_LINETTI_65 [Gordonia phage Linetti]